MFDEKYLKMAGLLKESVMYEGEEGETDEFLEGLALLEAGIPQDLFGRVYKVIRKLDKKAQERVLRYANFDAVYAELRENPDQDIAEVLSRHIDHTTEVNDLTQKPSEAPRGDLRPPQRLRESEEQGAIMYDYKTGEFIADVSDEDYSEYLEEVGNDPVGAVARDGRVVFMQK